MKKNPRIQNQIDFNDIIKQYLTIYSNESDDLKLAREQITSSEDIVSRKNFVGHFTASVYVYCVTTKKILLIHHKYLDKFLQPGGHIDEKETPLDAAKRELLEETGISKKDVDYRPLVTFNPQVPFDINSHFIPENKNKNEDSHYHHDMGYLMTVDRESNIQLEDSDSGQYKWVDWDLFRYNNNFKKVSKKIESLISVRSSSYLYNEILDSQSFKPKNYRCVVVQHVIPNSYEYIMHLYAIFGQNLTVLAKPKSINNETLSTLRSHNVEVLISQRNDNFLKDVITTRKEKCIVIDIGGYFAELSTQRNLPILAIIEDTENGYKKYLSKGNDIQYPFVSVSRSPLKDNEDRLVGESIVTSTDSILRDLNVLIDYCKCAVIGYGKIGQGISGLLQKRNIKPYVVDQNKVRLVKAVNNYCYATTLENAVSKSEIIFCATGNGVISIDDFRKIRNGSYIVSVTSSDDEFDTKYLGSEYKREKVSNYVDKYHSDNNYFYLLNNGNAVNFIYSPALGSFIYLILSEIIAMVGYIIDNDKKLSKNEMIIPNLSTIREKIACEWLKEFDHHGC